MKGGKRLSQINTSQLNELRARLLTEKRTIEKRLAANDHYGLKQSERDMTGDLSTSDNHPADMGTEVYERGKDISLNERSEHRLEEITRALSSMATGQYGTCTACDTPIDYERLDAVPTTAFCVDHAKQSGLNAQRERPIEEEFLTPPFGRTSLDERSDMNFFDGEDAWQIVESWGTSNSPAMAENPDEQSNYDHMFIEADEHDGYVESIESFLATDMYGNALPVIKNRKYRQYMDNDEGDLTLEVGKDFDDNLDH